MQTDKITIDNSGIGMKEVLSEAERFAEYLQMDKKDSLRIRLLTEEALGMVRGVVGKLRGYFWMEASGEKDFKIHIETVGHLDREKRKELIAVSFDGKNESDRGFMRKLLALAQHGGQEEAAAEEDPSMEQFRSLGQGRPEAGPGDATWLLSVFRKNVRERAGSDKKTATETSHLEDLEKSIVASIADDVKVYARKDGAEIVIEKSLSAG